MPLRCASSASRSSFVMFVGVESLCPLGAVTRGVVR